MWRFTTLELHTQLYVHPFSSQHRCRLPLVSVSPLLRAWNVFVLQAEAVQAGGLSLTCRARIARPLKPWEVAFGKLPPGLEPIQPSASQHSHTTAQHSLNLPRPASAAAGGERADGGGDGAGGKEAGGLGAAMVLHLVVDAGASPVPRVHHWGDGVTRQVRLQAGRVASIAGCFMTGVYGVQSFPGCSQARHVRTC